MIYDCFLFYNELELLEIRLHELKDVVDRFVLVESTITFQHDPKPLYFEENKERFAPFLDRIDHVVVRDAPTTDPWATEFHQRNAVVRGCIGAALDDVVILSDADEIPTPAVIRKYLTTDMDLYTLEQSNHWYFLNCKTPEPWVSAKIMRFRHLWANQASKLRLEIVPVLSNGGWHFSYMGGVDRIVQKLKSFAHADFNHPDYTDPVKLTEKIERGEDFLYLDRQDYFDFERIDATYPSMIVDREQHYREIGFIKDGPAERPERPKRTGETATVWTTGKHL